MSAAVMGSNADASFDDEELVALCLIGHEGAWAGLAGRLRRLAQRLLASRSVWPPADIDDLVQEVLAILLADDRRLLRAYTPHRAQLTTYLTVILRRCATARQRKQSREIVPDHPSPDFVPAPPDPETQQTNEIWDMVERTLPSLDVLILRYTVLGYQADEIAALLSYTQGCLWTAEAVRQRRSRAFQRLRRRMKGSF